MQNVKWDRVLLLVGVVALIWAISNGGLPGTTTSQPLFKVDKPACLIVWDDTPVAKAALSKGQLDIIEGTAEGTVKDLFLKSGGYAVQVVGKDNTNTDFTYPWMKEARLVEMKSYPWLVASSPKSGLSIPLDKDITTEKVVSQLKPVLEAK